MIERFCVLTARHKMASSKFAKGFGIGALSLVAFAAVFAVVDAAFNKLPLITNLRQRATAVRKAFGYGERLPASPLAQSPDKSPAAPAYPDWYESSAYTGKVFHYPGLRLPSVRPASEAPLPLETPVIGVVIEGHSRAYLPQAMEDFSAHVINDRIGDHPVTVTYCVILKCARVFTKTGEHEPLNVSLGGIVQGKMALEIDGKRFAQDAPDLPVDDVVYTRTSWGQWKTGHPETDVFVGDVLDDEAVGVD